METIKIKIPKPKIRKRNPPPTKIIKPKNMYDRNKIKKETMETIKENTNDTNN